MNQFADIVFPIAVDKRFTYRVPEELRSSVRIGQRVSAPFQNGKKEGFVVELTSETPLRNVRDIAAICFEHDAIGPRMMSLARWASQYYCTSWGSMLELASPSYLAQKRGASAEQPCNEGPRASLGISSKASPARGQTGVAKDVLRLIRDHRFGVFLLHKDPQKIWLDVYIELILSAIKHKRQSIVLFPEVALSMRFGAFIKDILGPRMVAMFHGGIAKSARRRLWHDIRTGEIPLIIGVRSAVFAPVKDPGLIIVDDEHNVFYKQESRGPYHARDVAVMRGKMQSCPVVLGSCSPSIESYSNVIKGKYYLLESGRGIDETASKRVKIIDMTVEHGFAKRPVVFSRYLIDSINRRLKSSEQTMLLLNKRGFARWVRCSSCGCVRKCPNCDISLIYHKDKDHVVCHYCGYAQKYSNKCPKCHTDSLRASGFGTERIAKKVKDIFPGAVVERLDADVARNRKRFRDIVKAYEQGAIDVLVGTQMIASGIDGPRTTLIGILYADQGLNIPDFRASERTFQALSQVAQIAYQKKKDIELIVQALNSDHYSIIHACKNDYRGFFATEIEHRESLNYPPFSHVIKIEFKGEDPGAVRGHACLFRQHIESEKSFHSSHILGPAPAIISKVRKLYRFHVLIKTKTPVESKDAIRSIFGNMTRSSKIRISIDVDPVSLL